MTDNELNLLKEQKEIAKQLEVQNKLKWLEMAHQAGIVDDEKFKENLMRCANVLFKG